MFTIPVIQKIYRGLLEVRLFFDYQISLIGQSKTVSLASLKFQTLEYVDRLRIKNAPYGQYLYTSDGNTPLLYASTYAALIRHLFDDLSDLTDQQRAEWSEYILSFQTEDGLFRDPIVANDLAETGDWWGWRHLTVHSLMALNALGKATTKKFALVSKYSDLNNLKNWFEGLDWEKNVDFTSNAVQNLGVLLQYARDFQGDSIAGEAVQVLFKMLDIKQNSRTGLWGDYPTNQRELSISVQAAYHIMLLYFYDNVKINYQDEIYRFTLKTQNILGGFGFRLSSSACDDIDSIDILVRLAIITNQKQRELIRVLQKALTWIYYNRNPDGGFVFRRASDFEYGHKLMYTKLDQSSLFATWFRLLSISYIYKYMDTSTSPFIYLSCPGYQFWRS